ncbi:hypothetical protein CC80DRAFT_509566 [Byssothecium circinans]|uniref:SH3 domain-containing protein n=1 Tax=Byssothecium circinans TaxID=147558 RepID=A0A6A5TNW8_9PLEO|nr:hypothetical protein CC80DRAFT_509566 [Byssothecium circinans]
MAATVSPNAIHPSTVLSRLEPLGPDQYFIAFGPEGRQFCGTPNGYSATFLPSKVCEDILGGWVKKVVWASYGSEPDSYFICYEVRGGFPAHRSGAETPTSLDVFVSWATSSASSIHKPSALRVQLGEGRSWLAWTGALWASNLVPQPLLSTLCALSSFQHQDPKLGPQKHMKLGWRGTIQSGVLKNVAWHKNGTYYVMTDKQHWDFKSEAVLKGWEELWNDGEEPSMLAHVSFDAHSATGDTFAFIKTQQPGKEIEFVVRFGSESMVSRVEDVPDPSGPSEQVPDPSGPSEQTPDIKSSEPDGPTNTRFIGHSESTKPADDHLNASASVPLSKGKQQAVHVPKPSSGPQFFQWAFAKHNGRPHRHDTWELNLKKGEKLKVLKDMGKDWFVVLNGSKEKGWAHRTSLKFGETRPHADPREAYGRWAEDTEKMLRSGDMTSFPKLSDYMDACGRDACQQVKKEALGICAHDLHELLRGSGQYSLELLKTQRNNWHPDKFARFCRPEHRERLKVQAEALFVMFGVLMDWMMNPPADRRAG